MKIVWWIGVWVWVGVMAFNQMHLRHRINFQFEMMEKMVETDGNIIETIRNYHE